MRKYDGNIIGLATTAVKLGNKCSDLLPVRELSECDTVSIWKGEGVCSQFYVIIKFDLYLSVFINSNSVSLNDLRHRIFGNTKSIQNKKLTTN